MIEKDRPLISVVMSVYKVKKKYLIEAVQSIINQTYSNFEFIILIDGIDGEISNIIRLFNDSRISVIQNNKNIGLTKSLNKGIGLAKGKYIARMDADDISLRTRFKEQIEFMENSPNCAVLGGIGGFIKKNKTGIMSTNNQSVIKSRMLFQNPGVVHPTAMIRKSTLEKYKIKYNEELKYAQDYGLWSIIIQYGEIKYLPKVVLLFREHNNRISTKHKEQQKYYANKVKLNQLYSLSSNFKKREKKLLTSLESGNLVGSPNEYIRFLNKLLIANDEKKVYPIKTFKKEVYFQWIKFVLKNTKNIFIFKYLFHMFSFRALWLSNWDYLYENLFKLKFQQNRTVKKVKHKA